MHIPRQHRALLIIDGVGDAAILCGGIARAKNRRDNNYSPPTGALRAHISSQVTTRTRLDLAICALKGPALRTLRPLTPFQCLFKVDTSLTFIETNMLRLSDFP
jgi:hypothetical protein